MENWKPVVGYEGLYEVSDLGRVKSLNWRNRGFERCLYLKPHNKGYLQVELAKDGAKKMYTVHRLVATAFVENPNGYPLINHKDENKLNNKAENLEWCTSSYNARYSIEKHPERTQGRSGRKGCHYKGINSEKQIVQTTLDGTEIRVWENSRTVFLETGMSDWSISECCRGNRHKAYGFKWHYAS